VFVVPSWFKEIGVASWLRKYIDYQLSDRPAPPGEATGDIVTWASPWPIVTVQPDTMPTAAPNATSLRKCRLS